MKDKEMAIRKEWQNLRTAAAGQKVSVQAFTAWGVEPVARIGREVFFLPADIVRNRVENALTRAAKAAPEPDVSEYENERREKSLLVRAQREGQELKNAQARRELAPLDLLSWTLTKVGAQIGAILDSIPLKVKNILPKLSAAEVEHIRREVVKAQNAAASVTVDLDEYYGAIPDPDRKGDQDRTADS
jgi:phage terminase Nu1 subunit (DNA packaging protein)